MSKHSFSTQLPRKAAENLKIVGEQILLARKRRGLSRAQMSERASCSELTLMRIERGSPTVAMGAYVRALFGLGLDEDILYLAQDDPQGRNLQDIETLNKGISRKKKRF